MLLLGFVTTSLLLRWLGAELFGAYRAASDWAGYLGLLDLGIPIALQSLLARAYSKNDEPATAAILAAGMRAYVRVCGLVLLVGAALAVAIPWLVPVGADSVTGLRLGFIIGLVPTLWLPLGSLRSYQEASQRGYVVGSLMLVQGVLIAGFSLLFAWLGYGLPGQFLAAAVGSLGFHVGVMWRAGRVLRRVPGALRSGGSWRDELSALKWPGFWQNVCGRLSMLTDNIIICGFLGPAEVVAFVVSQRLVMAVGAQAAGVGGHTWASLAELYHQGKHDLLNARLVELTRMTAVLTLAGIIPTAVFAAPFVRLWVGAEQYAGDLVPWLAAGNAFLLALLSVWSYLFTGTGFLRHLLPLQVVQTVVNVCLSLLATWLFGMPGPLLGTFIAMTCVYLWWEPLLLRKHYGTPLRPLAGAVLRPLCVAVPYAVALRALAVAYPPANWLALAAALAAAALAYLPLAWFLALDSQERRDWWHRGRLVLSPYPG
jgi:O-antigen/teichoic acid export membrane protein